MSLLQNPYWLYPVATGPKVVQSSGSVIVQGTSTNITFTMPSNVTAGNALLVMAEGYGVGGVTTPAGWTQYSVAGANAVDSSVAILIAANVAAGTNTVTVACPNWQSYQSGAMAEISGLSSTVPDISAIYNPGANINAPFTATATSTSNTTSANELLFYVLSIAQASIGTVTYTTPAGYTTLFDANDDSVDACGIGGYLEVSSIQTTPSVSVGVAGTASSPYAAPVLYLISLH